MLESLGTNSAVLRRKITWHEGLRIRCQYYCDEDGFGMTHDVQAALMGAIDRNGKIVRRFTLMD